MARAAECRPAAALLLLLLASAAPAGADDIRSRVEALSARIICNCDCGNKIVQKCYCGVADSLRQEIRAQVASGGSDEQVLAHFVSRYGEQILAAPTPEGFNLAAWAAPAAALLGGLLVAVGVLRRWVLRGRTQAPAPAAAGPPSSPDPYERAFEAEIASRRD